MCSYRAPWVSQHQFLTYFSTDLNPSLKTVGGAKHFGDGLESSLSFWKERDQKTQVTSEKVAPCGQQT